MVTGKSLTLVKLVRTADNTKRRDFLSRQIFCRCRIAGRAKLAKHEGDFVTLNQLANMLDRLRRAVGVVIGDVIDFSGR